ncbi:unnamed protein product [Heligmosomoides polygyrus]|uniref:Peptidase_M14 domain-containing protein n=1 Tax=Heligmosomoides polygyrus TaxID=6339 RepID=A0A3P8DKG5_HELPZ|nr:unnamed protein product [Heligmosomoides polygyrus]
MLPYPASVAGFAGDYAGQIGSSSDRCSEIYQGKGPFSEAEARAVRDTILSPELRGKVDAFLTLHTYSQEQVGRKALGALESVYGTKYRFGTGADILYPSSGGSDDWAKGKGGAKYVYLMELRPSEDGGLSQGPVACTRVSVFGSARKSGQFPVAPRGGTDIATK